MLEGSCFYSSVLPAEAVTIQTVSLPMNYILWSQGKIVVATEALPLQAHTCGMICHQIMTGCQLWTLDRFGDYRKKFCLGDSWSWQIVTGCLFVSKISLLLTYLYQLAYSKLAPNPGNTEGVGAGMASGVKCLKVHGWATLALICVAAAHLLVVRQWEVWVREDQQ